MEERFGFDPQLPALPLAFDRVAVARLFEEQWPAPADTAPAGVRVEDCRLQDTKYQPLVRCVTVYELRVASPGAAPWPAIGVVEISPAGPAHRLFVEDAALPGLRVATDPVRMAARFAEALASDTGGGPVERCAITPIRYKPGARCVLRYALGTGAESRVFFGKLFASDGDRVRSVLSTLHDVGRATAGMPDVLQPVAYWPDLQLLAQPAVAGGVELNTLAFDPAVAAAGRERWLDAAGRGLAALHGSAGAEGPRRTLPDDLAELREYQAPMAQVDPALAADYTALCETVAARTGAVAATPPVPSHGAFRPDQFMIEGERLVMIDLDSFCWAAPARDLGNFLAYLRWKAIRRPDQAAFLDQAAGIFLAGYGTAGPAVDAGEGALYQAAALLKIAGRRYRSLSVKEWPRVPDLLAAARTLLHSDPAK